MTIRLHESDKIEKFSVDHVTELSAGILKSFEFGSVPVLECLAALTTVISHISLNVLEKCDEKFRESNRVQILDVLDKVRKRVENVALPSKVTLS